MSGEIGGSRLGNVIKAKEDLLKSPEQLEKEKREIISSRLVKINLDRLTKDDLVEEVYIQFYYSYLKVGLIF
jgi:hypothetical protein